MSYDHGVFLRNLSSFTRTLVTPYDLDTVLDELVLALTDVLGLCGTAVMLARDGRLEVATAIPPHVAELEKLQYDTQTGPCVDAYHSGEITAVNELSQHAQRWPEYCAVADRIGVTAAAGIPMRLNTDCIGALSLYGDGPRDWPDEDLEVATAMADMATGYLVNASKLHQQEQLTEQLQRALESRVVIEQAKGFTASARGCSMEQAFERIRRHARSNNMTIRSVADEIVNAGLHV